MKVRLNSTVRNSSTMAMCMCRCMGRVGVRAET